MSEVIKKCTTLLTAIIPDEEKEEWSATEVSQKLEIPIQTVHRLLSSLTECGFVYKNNETKKFRLGLNLIQLGLSVRDNLLVHKGALPIMKNLTKKTEQSVYLTVPEGNEGVLIDFVSADPLYKISEPIGRRTPLCTGASKKVMLAYMKLKTRKQILQSLMNIGQVSNLNKLEYELKNIKKSGIAISSDETAKGIIKIAAPIFSSEYKVVASICLASSNRKYLEHKKMFISEVKSAAKEISEELGCIESHSVH
ncbi:transcriptional regulator, IclR family [Alteribacillus bidgolensis]|uniref:Transcriptional regulator, IclR family n=1 Tax=Alteribacillus bidgolensis TaxID=930129 RepID=A0A1G8R3W1_9BACI|nr:transcriptional regulator, IclR family [Alteribacillus bidgolensis]